MNKKKEEEISRNKKHELIMQCIYSKLSFNDIEYNVDINTISKNIFKKNLDKFSKNIILKVIDHFDEITLAIEKKLINWKFNRISNITKAILFMSYAHYKYVEKIDKAIIINIAIKLAKKYLDTNDYKFINGILDKILN